MWLRFQQLQMSCHCSMCSKCHICHEVCAVTFSKLYQQGRTVCRLPWALRGVILSNASTLTLWCHRNPLSSHGCQPVYLLNASLDTAGVHEKSSLFTELISLQLNRTKNFAIQVGYVILCLPTLTRKTRWPKSTEPASRFTRCENHWSGWLHVRI